MFFFVLPTWLPALVIAVVMFGATLAGLLVGRRLGDRSQDLREPFGVLQGALVGLMGLVLAFGLSLTVGRYESRRADVVTEANTIGTTYLRADTRRAGPHGVADAAAQLHRHQHRDRRHRSRQRRLPTRPRQERAVPAQYQSPLWALAGQALDQAPVASAPRLYVETLNETFDGSPPGSTA
jgi:hypothetical protein